jgi:uncharacterized membrane protein
MTHKNKAKLEVLVKTIRSWNINDIKSFEDTTPPMDMLKARKKIINQTLKLVSTIKAE